MPWCPQCDEVFPEGPECPRCHATLLDVEEPSAPVPVPGALSQLRVPRRIRRGFERLGGPAVPSRGMVAVAALLVALAAVFALGRVTAVTGDGPAVRAHAPRAL